MSLPCSQSSVGLGMPRQHCGSRVPGPAAHVAASQLLALQATSVLMLITCNDEIDRITPVWRGRITATGPAQNERTGALINAAAARMPKPERGVAS